MVKAAYLDRRARRKLRIHCKYKCLHRTKGPHSCETCARVRVAPGQSLVWEHLSSIVPSTSLLTLGLCCSVSSIMSFICSPLTNQKDVTHRNRKTKNTTTHKTTQTPDKI